MATKRGLIIGLIAFVVAMLAYLMTQTPRGTAKMTDVPDFALPLLAPARPTRMAQLRGKVVILDFWATWCGPCQMSMPRLEQIYKRYKDKGLVVIGISDDGPETKDKVAPTAKAIGVTYPIAIANDMDNIETTFVHPSIPALYVIDKQGVLVETDEGYSPDQMDRLDNTIGDMLAK